MAFPFDNGVAVVTGAAKGIGAQLAHGLASRRCHLALIDRDGDGLAAVAAAARRTGVIVTEHRVDVSDGPAIEALPGEVLARHGRANLLINNAGVAILGNFDQIEVADIEWLFAINFWGTVRMCKAFVPLLGREPAAQIVNLSSIYGIIAPAGQTAYAASKFAVRGFSEALRHELEDTGIGVSVVHPGGIRTTIAASARVAPAIDPQDRASRLAAFDRMVQTSPEAAAARIIAGIDRREKRILIGRDARQVDILQRLFPVSSWAILKRLAARRSPAAP